jgi:hypothetical protein
LRRLPAPRPPALTAWLAAADRLRAGNQALAMLETTTLLLPPATAAPAPVVPLPPKPVPSPEPAVPVTSISTRTDLPASGSPVGRIGDIVREAVDLRPVFADIFGGISVF